MLEVKVVGSGYGDQRDCINSYMVHIHMEHELLASELTLAIITHVIHNNDTNKITPITYRYNNVNIKIMMAALKQYK